jgi:spore coat protein CotH
MVKGVVSSLLPEAPDSVDSVCVAVFQAFAIRARKLPRKTLLAYWFLKTAWFAVRAERKNLQLGPQTSAVGRATEFTLKRVFKLKRKPTSLFILAELLHEPLDSAARTARLSVQKVEKLRSKIEHRFQTKLRKKFQIDLSTILQGWTAPNTEDLAQAIRVEFQSAVSTQSKPRRVRAIVFQWRLLKLRTLLRRFLRGVGIVLAVFGLLVASFAYLATHGYLNLYFLQMSAKQALKDVPELAIPANPWPQNDAEKSSMASGTPKKSEELFLWNRIWPARLSFSGSDWQRIKPSHIEPIPNMMGSDGRLILRNPKAKRSGLSGVVGLEFDWTEAQLDFGGQHFEKVAARYRGNGTYINSLYGPKQSFKVDLNKFTKKQKLAGLKELNLLNSVPDNSYMFDALSERLFRDLGVPAPRTSYAYLTLNAPGTFTNQPLGLYVVVENIDSTFAEDRFGSKDTPIFKPVTYDLFKDLGDDWNAYAAIYDLKTKATDAEENRVIAFSRLVTHASDDEFARKLPEFLDLEEFAAFLAGHVLLSSYDGFLSNGQNFYLYLDPRSNRFGFISWDQDHSWGEFRYVGTVEGREEASIWEPASYKFHFLERVMKVEAFRKAYRNRLEAALRDLFTVDRLYAQVDELATSIRTAVSAESQFRLKRFDEAVTNKWTPGPRNGGPPEGPLSRVHQIKRYIPNRIESIREQLDGKSNGERLQRH